MNTQMNTLINKMIANPRLLFLIDSLGAVVSAFFLGVILVRFESVFGMPKKTLYVLALIPCVFAIYSFICYQLNIKNWRPYLKVIAMANLLYCFLSMGLLYHHLESLTLWGIGYFINEFVIIITLVFIEFKAAYSIENKLP